jgi:hypothetical protein
MYVCPAEPIRRTIQANKEPPNGIGLLSWRTHDILYIYFSTRESCLVVVRGAALFGGLVRFSKVGVVLFLLGEMGKIGKF